METGKLSEFISEDHLKVDKPLQCTLPLQASLFVIADHSFHDYASNQSIPADLLPTRNCSNFVVVCASSVAIGTPPDGPTACQVNSTHCVVVLQFV